MSPKSCQGADTPVWFKNIPMETVQGSAKRHSRVQPLRLGTALVVQGHVLVWVQMVGVRKPKEWGLGIVGDFS